MTLVACFGRIPRFCRLDEFELEKFDPISSLFESPSESSSSELPHGDNWPAIKERFSVFRSSPQHEHHPTSTKPQIFRSNDIPEYWSKFNGALPIWLRGVDPRMECSAVTDAPPTPFPGDPLLLVWCCCNCPGDVHVVVDASGDSVVIVLSAAALAPESRWDGWWCCCWRCCCVLWPEGVDTELPVVELWKFNGTAI